jgi:hypothetical protein
VGGRERPIINSQNEPRAPLARRQQGGPRRRRPMAAWARTIPPEGDRRRHRSCVHRCVGDPAVPQETMARLVEAVATGRHPDATPAWQLQRYSGTWGNGQLRPDHVPAPRRIAGEPVRAARGPQNSGRPRRQAGQPATRMPRATPQADCRIWTARLSRNP